MYDVEEMFDPITDGSSRADVYRRPGEGRRNSMGDIITRDILESGDPMDAILLEEAPGNFDWRAIMDLVNSDLDPIDYVYHRAGLLDDISGDEDFI